MSDSATIGMVVWPGKRDLRDGPRPRFQFGEVMMTQEECDQLPDGAHLRNDFGEVVVCAGGDVLGPLEQVVSDR